VVAKSILFRVLIQSYGYSVVFFETLLNYPKKDRLFNYYCDQLYELGQITVMQ